MELSPESDPSPKESASAAEADKGSDDSDGGWTPVKFAVALFLAIAFGGLGASFALVWRGDFRVKKKPYNPLLASIRAEEKAKRGDEIWLRFEVVNRGADPVPIADHSGRPERQEQYDVVVRPINEERPLPLLGPGAKETKSLEPPPMILLLPGKKISWRLNLARYVTIEKAGRYQVTISRQPFVDKIRVEAAPLILQID